ncbi:MAG: polysaccharide biosynthesis tyrosine autokinase [Proteobacteria bacterium]|nr:polysaccharide biosynthesis tyrosine autokinase [Pseudomonadota bacterium]
MQEKEIHLRDYIRVLRKRKQTVFTFFIITVTLVLIGVLTTSQEPMYQASTRVLVEKSDPSSLIEGSSSYYRSWDPEFLETQAQIITSSSVALKVVKTLSLDTTYKHLFFEDEEEGHNSFSMVSTVINWVRSLTRPDPPEETDSAAPMFEKNQETSPAEIIAQMISQGIELTPVRDTRILDISFQFKNPVIAEMIVNTLVKAYIEELLDMRMQSSTYAIQWMSQKADEERIKLEKAESELSAYMRAKDIITIEDKITIVPQKITALSDELTKAETRRKELEAIIEQLRRVSVDEAETIPEISQRKTLQDMRKDLIKAEQTVTEYSKKYGRRHPLMIRSLNALKVIQENRVQELKRLTKEIANDYDLAKTRETDLTHLLSQAKAEAINLNEKYIQYKILKRDVETNRSLYNALISKIKEQAVSEKVQTVNVWTIEAAKTPDIPVSSHKKRKLLLGLILGLFGGIGLAFFIEYLDNTIKSVEETEQRLGTPVLGVISLLKGNTDQIEHVVTNEPLSAISENYKAIRTSILLSSADRPPACLLVTSMAPREGKTTTVSNLASALAQSGKKVVIIDGDLRRPRIHKVFNIANTSGLSTHLAGSDSPIIVGKNLPDGILVIPSGPIPPDPSELLGSARLNTLISNLKKNVDIILIDSPPLLSVSDGLILSTQTDGVLIVTRAGMTTYEIAGKGLKQLKDVNAHITGLIINGANITKNSYDYYGYGYYAYDTKE